MHRMRDEVGAGHQCGVRVPSTSHLKSSVLSTLWWIRPGRRGKVIAWGYGEGIRGLCGLVGAEVPVVALEIADREVAGTIFLVGWLQSDLRTGRLGARVQRIWVIAGRVNPALANAIAILVVARAAKHDQVTAPTHFGMGDIAVVVIVQRDGLEAECVLQPLMGGLGVVVTERWIELHGRRLSRGNQRVLNKWELRGRAANQLAELAIEMRLVRIAGLVGDICQLIAGLQLLSRMLHAKQPPDCLRR